MFRKVSIFFLLLIFQSGFCNELDDNADVYISKVFENHHIESDFNTLSPALLKGITKSFILLDKCLPTLLSNGSYLEFGLYKGFSLWFAQQVGENFVSNDFQYFGFDSFIGLPPESQDYKGLGCWGPGIYASSLKEVTLNLKTYGTDFLSLHLIPGWFSQDLFTKWSKRFGKVFPAIITIDSDVYESCKEVLQFFVNYLQPGTILLFDDFNNAVNSPEANCYSERKALIEFLSCRPDVKLMHLFPFGFHGYAFIVTSCNETSLENSTIEEIIRLIEEIEFPNYPIF